MFPLGALTQKIFARVKIHAIVQSIGLVFVLVGFIIATTFSKMYIRVSITPDTEIALAITLLTYHRSRGTTRPLTKSSASSP